MKKYMIIEAVKYAMSFIQNHFWAIVKMLLVFMAVAVAIGFIVAGSSLILLGALSNKMWLTVALESPLLAVVGFIVYGIWNVSFITYLLALERTGSASVQEQLKKSWSLRVLKIMAFDLVVVLFMGMVALAFGSIALGAWWFGGMQIALWLRVVLGIAGSVLFIGVIYLLIRLFFTKIVIADTNTDMFTALSTSWSVTQVWFWRLFLMLVIVGMLSGLVTMAAAQLTRLFVFLFDGIIKGLLLGSLLGKSIEVVAVLINSVFISIITLYYYLQFKVAKTLIAGR